MNRHDCKRETFAVLLSCSMLAGCGAKAHGSSTDPGESGAASTGNDETIFVPQLNGALEVFVDDARVYWLTNQESLGGCLKDQCATSKVTYYTWSAGGPTLDVALDGANIYWYRMAASNDGVDVSMGPPSAVLSCPRSGCGPGPQTVIENIEETSLASDGTFLYWGSRFQTSVFRCALGNCSATQTVLAQTQGFPENLSVSGGYVYWMASGANVLSTVIRRVATDGASPVEDVATTQSQMSSLMVREPYVYFTESAAGTVLRCPVTGCPSGPTVVASGLSDPASVVADDTNAYWVNGGNTMTNSVAPDGSFAKCAVGGCGVNATTLASPETFVLDWLGDHAVAIDDQYVYWVTQGAERDNGFPDAAIHRLAK